MKFKILVILCLLVIFTVQQRGGGGGGRSSSRSSGFSRRYYRSSGGSCGPECSRTAGIITGGIVGTTLLTIFGCYCCQRANAIKERKRIIDSCRSKYNLHKNNIITSDQYQMVLNNFLRLLQESKNKFKSFTYWQGGIPRQIQLSSVVSQQLQVFDTQIKIKGNDFFGSWEGDGGFIVTEAGPFFWMIKWYDNQQAAGQTGAWDTLVYESNQVTYAEAYGRWFYEGMEMNSEYSGNWRIGLQPYPQ